MMINHEKGKGEVREYGKGRILSVRVGTDNI